MSRRHFRTVLTSRVARLLGLAVLAVVASMATPSLGRSIVSRNDALPRVPERLTAPLALPHCGMQIVEWRSSGAFHDETAPSADAQAVIDDTCRDAFARYGAFLRARGLPSVRERPLSLPAVSLLPANVLLDGKSERALNDLPNRFEAVAPACCYWGLYVDSLDHLFVRNDPLIKDDAGRLVANPRFVRTLTHELSHILSARLGVWDLVGYDRRRDEDLAEDFVGFMGMHFPAESSAEDLAFHRGIVPFAPATPVARTAPARDSNPPSRARAARDGVATGDTSVQR